ncbi:MAG: sigma-54 interaction domain-containing protein [bacterium]
MSEQTNDSRMWQLEHENYRLKTLFEVAQTLSACRDSQDIFAGVLAILAGIFGAGRALALANANERWQCVASRDEQLTIAAQARLQDVSMAALDKVLQAILPLLNGEEHEQQCAVAEVKIQDRVQAAFVLGPRLLPEPYSGDDRELMAAIASFTGRAWENLRLYETLKEAEQKLRSENLSLRVAAKKELGENGMLGQSAPMQRVLQLVRNYGQSEAHVLITGETGTGKELVARALHYHSPRAEGPFLGINCTAIPEHLVETEFFGIEAGIATGVKKHAGLFEQAEGGTLFIDEIGDMPAPAQAKLLRVLQERKLRRVGGDRDLPADVRVLTATNKNLVKEIAAGRFREDLYYRIAVLELRLPPLRERQEDVALLAHHFLQIFEKSIQRKTGGLSAELLHAFENYPWPGNVRELENEIERLVTLAEPQQPLRVEHLSSKFRNARPAVLTEKPERIRAAVDALEREMILAALQKHKGNKSRAAQVLGLSRLGLQHKIDRLGLASRNEGA